MPVVHSYYSTNDSHIDTLRSSRRNSKQPQPPSKMGPAAGAGSPCPPCKLVPPCQHGGHGAYLDPKGEHAAKPIGKYYFTEDALKHDLAALKKGEIYEADEFYKRAKAWYKAEIDRLLHLEKVTEVGRVEKE